MQRYFITGIGTDVGKTLISAIVTEALEADYWKPIQAGELDYADMDKVRDWISNTTTQFHPNTYALKTPMSPHAAAAIEGTTISMEEIKTPKTNNNLVVEGAGGLLVPINDTETIVDLILPTDKVILVSRHYLGSINHTLLSAEILRQRGIKNIGILFNGNEHKTTEAIIEKMTCLPILGRVNEEAMVNKEMVSKYAVQLMNSLKNL